jgi:hypothetical protein
LKSVQNDGREVISDYADGVLEARSYADVNDAFIWNTIDYTYATDGSVLTEIKNFDDGRHVLSTYQNNILTDAVATDVDNAYSWKSYTNTYDDFGELVSRFTTYDNEQTVYTDFG